MYLIVKIRRRKKESQCNTCMQLTESKHMVYFLKIPVYTTISNIYEFTGFLTILVSVHGSLILYQALYDITQFILCSYLQIWLYVPWSTVSRHRGPLGVPQHFSSCPHSPSLRQRGALLSSSGSISWTLSKDGHLSLRLAVNVR